MNDVKYSIWIKGETEPFYTGNKNEVMMFGIDLRNECFQTHLYLNDQTQVVKASELPQW